MPGTSNDWTVAKQHKIDESHVSTLLDKLKVEVGMTKATDSMPGMHMLNTKIVKEKSLFKPIFYLLTNLRILVPLGLRRIWLC